MAVKSKPDKQEKQKPGLLKNLSYLLGSQLVTWSISLGAFILITRLLGPEALGDYGLADAIWMIGSIFVLFGIDVLLTKEVAKDPGKLNELLSTAFVITIFTYLITFGAVLGLSYIAGYSAIRIQVIVIIGISNFFRSLIVLIKFGLGGLERFDLNSIATTIGRILFAVGSIAILLISPSLILFSFVIVAVTIIELIIVAYYLKQGAPDYRFTFNSHLIGTMLRKGTPYLLSGIFFIGYKQFDMIVMSILIKDPGQLGWYSAADRIFGSLLFIPTILMTAIFPILSRKHSEEADDDLGTYLDKSFNMLFIFGIPIGLGIAAIATPISELIFGQEYTQSGLILAVYGIVMIFTYQNILLGQFLISIDKQNQWTWVMGIATLATLPLDLVLVPFCLNRFGVAGVGGALAFVFTEAGMMLAAFFMLPQGYLTRENFTVSLKAIFSGLAMAGVVWLVKDQFLLIPVVVGAVVYFAMIFLTRAIPSDDLETVTNYVKTKIPRRGMST